jgi:hypothetical protein
MKTKGVSEENAMKGALVGWALGLGAALAISLCALLLSCQAGCNQHAWFEDLEAQPAWASCGLILECLS